MTCFAERFFFIKMVEVGGGGESQSRFSQVATDYKTKSHVMSIQSGDTTCLITKFLDYFSHKNFRRLFWIISST